jgi:hypothetical protein
MAVVTMKETQNPLWLLAAQHEWALLQTKRLFKAVLVLWSKMGVVAMKKTQNRLW